MHNNLLLPVGNVSAVAELIQDSIALDAHASDVSLSILNGNNTQQLYGTFYDTTNATAQRIAEALSGQSSA